MYERLLQLFTEFDPEDCPADCSRPCEVVCPANAISFRGNTALGVSNGTETPGILKVFYFF